MNVAELIQRTRDIVADRADDNSTIHQWDDAEILRHVNAGQDHLWSKARQADEEWGLDHALLSDFNPTFTSLPGFLIQCELGQFIDTIVYMREEITGSGQGSEIVKTRVGNAWHYKADTAWIHPSARGWWQGGPRMLFFTDTSAPINATQVRVWFQRKVPHLCRFRATVYPAATTISVNRSTDLDSDPAVGGLGVLETGFSYYRGTEILCTEAAGADPERISFLCIGFTRGVYPIFTVTLSAAHGAAGTTHWEVLPYFPEEHHELIAMVAARKAFLKGGDIAQAKVVSAEAGSLMEDFLLNIEQRQIQAPRSVNFLENS